MNWVRDYEATHDHSPERIEMSRADYDELQADWDARGLPRGTWPDWMGHTLKLYIKEES
jgi:hypothetical protein